MRMDSALGTVTSSLRATKQESSERNSERKKGWGWETERKTETESRMFKVNALTFFFSAQQTDPSFSVSNRLVLNKNKLYN